MTENIGRHHLHKRKRIHLKHEKYPHPKKFKRVFDNVIFIVAILGPFMALPQLIKIWVNENAAGVSIISWGAFFVISIFWFAYGVLHRERPIIISSSIWATLQLFIVVGIVLYG